MATMQSDFAADQRGLASRVTTTSVVGVVLFFAALIGVLYARILPDLVLDWWDDPNYSHGFLVPLFSGFVLGQRRETIRALDMRASWWGLVMILAGVAMLIVGQIGAEEFLSRSSLIVILGGLVWFHAGWPMLRVTMFPLLFLLFMIP